MRPQAVFSLNCADEDVLLRLAAANSGVAAPLGGPDVLAFVSASACGVFFPPNRAFTNSFPVFVISARRAKPRTSTYTSTMLRAVCVARCVERCASAPNLWADRR